MPGLSNDGHAITAPVGTYAANAFGFHDLHGNVSEWCLDTFTQLPLPRAGGRMALRRDLLSKTFVMRGGSFNFVPVLAADGVPALRAKRLPHQPDGLPGGDEDRPGPLIV